MSKSKVNHSVEHTTSILPDYGADEAGFLTVKFYEGSPVAHVDARPKGEGSGYQARFKVHTMIAWLEKTAALLREHADLKDERGK